MKTLINYTTICLVVWACGSTGRNTEMPERISGAYAREYKNRVMDAATGKEMGVRTVRDTIFIKSIGEEFAVSNRKWKMNDFDQSGWQTLDQGDDKPILGFTAKFNRADSVLYTDGGVPIYVSVGKEQVLKSWNSHPYNKIP